jgi:polysaccharide biosynthesis/export protein
MTLPAGLALCMLLMAGCTAVMPTIGPSRRAIEQSTADQVLPSIKVVDVTQDVTRRLLAQHASPLFSEVLDSPPIRLRPVGPGDMLQVTIWEASPATLFGAAALTSTSSTTGTTGSPGFTTPNPATTLPVQPVDEEGNIGVPFAGRVPAAGRTLPEIAAAIKERLTGKANQPEVLVLVSQNLSSQVTVVGEVTTSTRMPLTAARERLLDALASAAGPRQPISKTSIQITRGSHVYALPLETIIEDPRQNIRLEPGDVITALFQPFSFTALGATGKNDEITFETQGISLAQALARSGGMLDQRSNPRGVFVFRLEPAGDAAQTQPSGLTTIDGRVPVVYRLDLSDPRSLFLMQSFPIADKDVLYVSNAPVAELQKFLNLLFSLSYPILTGKQVGF